MIKMGPLMIDDEVAHRFARNKEKTLGMMCRSFSRWLAGKPGKRKWRNYNAGKKLGEMRR
jgi:hypothetical protein